MSFTIKLLAIILLASLIMTHWFSVIHYKDKMTTLHQSATAVKRSLKADLDSFYVEISDTRRIIGNHMTYHPGETP